MSSKLSAMRSELEECQYALEEAQQDKFTARSVIDAMKAEITKREKAISAAEAGEEEEDPAEGEDTTDTAVVDGDEGDFEDNDHEEILEEGDAIPEDAGDLGEDEEASLPVDDQGVEINPLVMPAKLRRELGDVNAEILDDYALSVQKKTRSFFHMLRQHLDLGEVDANDGNKDLVELLLEEVGKKGVSKIRIHFPEWREFVMKQLAKDMQAMFRQVEPELEEEVSIQVPEDTDEVVDGVDEKALAKAPISLNAPPQTGELRRAKRIEVAPVAPLEGEEQGDEEEQEPEEEIEASVEPDPTPAIAAAALPVFTPAKRVSFSLPAARDLMPGPKKTIRLT